MNEWTKKIRGGGGVCIGYIQTASEKRTSAIYNMDEP